jgi:hypothetical protein
MILLTNVNKNLDLKLKKNIKKFADLQYPILRKYDDNFTVFYSYFYTLKKQ